MPRGIDVEEDSFCRRGNRSGFAGSKAAALRRSFSVIPHLPTARLYLTRLSLELILERNEDASFFRTVSNDLVLEELIASAAAIAVKLRCCERKIDFSCRVVGVEEQLDPILDTESSDAFMCDPTPQSSGGGDWNISGSMQCTMLESEADGGVDLTDSAVTGGECGGYILLSANATFEESSTALKYSGVTNWILSKQPMECGGLGAFGTAGVRLGGDEVESNGTDVK
jgi:hypothetical protein